MAVGGLLAVAVSGLLLTSCGRSEAPYAPALGRKRTVPSNVLPAGPAPPTSRTVEECDAACSGCTVLLASDATQRRPSRPLRDYEKAALDTYFRSHLLSNECTSDPQHLELNAIGSVDDASTVKEIVDGAFTAPGAKQTFISFFVGRCGLLGSHAEHYGTTVGLLFERERLIASGTDGPTLAVELQAVDLDNDGVSELVELTADYASATTSTGAAVWSYLDGPLRALATFQLSHDSCLLPHGEHYEADLLTRWDEARRTLCFRTRRRVFACPPEP